jgi:hypothetical protein
MSSLRHLMKDGALDMALIPDRLQHYTNRLEDWKADLSLQNKNLRDTLIDQHSIAAYYDEIKAELYTFVAFLEMKRDQRAGEVNQMIKEDSRFDHSDRSIALLIKKDPDYILHDRLRMEADELYRRAYSICNQFQQRAYTLTNIVKVMESELQDVTLTKEHE